MAVLGLSPHDLKQRVGKAYRRWRNLRATEGVESKEAWTEALDHEMAFWRAWFKTSGSQWPEDYKFRIDPDTAIQDSITKHLTGVGSRVRMLDVGAGPLTLVGKRWAGREFELTAVDALANKYDFLLKEAGLIPPIRTRQCESERLTELFSNDSFDVVYASNTLDHSYQPMDAIRQMLNVAKPGGIVLLQHFRNEAENAEYDGLHQWNFDLVNGECLLWRPNTKWVLDKELADRAIVTGTNADGVVTVVITKRKV
jgi:SAM-dependent methyltransferase